MLDQSNRMRPVADQPIYLFTFPDSICNSDPHLPKTFGIVELTAKQLISARVRCKSNAEKLMDETIKQSIVEIDGKEVDGSRAEVESFYDNMKQKALQFVTAAYHKVNTLTDDEAGDSLDSFQVKA